MNNKNTKLPFFIKSKFGLRHLASDERGLSTVEYLILLAVIVVGCVGIWNTIGGDVEKKLEAAQSDVSEIGAKKSSK